MNSAEAVGGTVPACPGVPSTERETTSEELDFGPGVDDVLPPPGRTGAHREQSVRGACGQSEVGSSSSAMRASKAVKPSSRYRGWEEFMLSPSGQRPSAQPTPDRRTFTRRRLRVPRSPGPGLRAGVAWRWRPSQPGALPAFDCGGGSRLGGVDPEAFDYPNLMTYSLGDIGSASRGDRKTALVRAALATASVTTWDGDARSYLLEIDAGRLPAPRLLLNGLDSITARHDANRIRSDVTIDASTGGAVGTTIGLAKAFHHGPCLRCYYPHAQAPLPSLADVTGMPVHLLADGDHVITEADIELARPEVQSALREHAGSRICALPMLLGIVPDAGAYRPSAAFVAQQAAALAVGALIRTMTGSEGPNGYEIEYDALFGWKPGARMERRLSATCECQTQVELIRTVRSLRFGERDG